MMSIYKKFYLLLTVILLYTSFSFAQFSAKPLQLIPPITIENEITTPNSKEFGTVDRRGLVFGINMGMLKANGHSALYYNGSPDNENNIKYILDNKYYNDEIKKQLNNYAFKLYSFPTTMSYDASIMVGFHARYNFTNTAGIFIQFNFSKLNTTGQFALSTDSVNYTSQASLRYYSIYGQEQRSYIDIGFQKQWFLGKLSNFFFEGGINFTNVLVKKSGIIIGDLDYSIVNVYGSQKYIPNAGMQPYDIRQGGIGFGVFGGGGVCLNFNEKLSIEPGLNVYYQSINLANYDQYRINYTLFVRLVLRDFL
ncbi:MAG: hypothetical protein HXX18_04805 [Bacteroidetes bacterium]|nr:hypothetical protein [Bacteroidota bacterium]